MILDLATIEKLEKTDRKAYEESLKGYRDYKNTLDTSYHLGVQDGELLGIEKGIVQGIEKGSENTKRIAVVNLYKMGIPIENIATALELTEQQARKILIEAGIKI